MMNAERQNEISNKPALQAFSLPGRLGKKLMALDLEPIKYKLVKEGGWTLAKADTVEPHYKAYLFLLASQPGTLWVPSLQVDEMWHMHILDTQKYMADCAQLFGRYLHHFPYLGMKDAEDKAHLEALYRTTKATALAKFGLSLEPQIELADCGGGGCGGGSSCGSSCSSCSSPSVPSCSTPTIIPTCVGSSSCSSPSKPLNERGRKPDERKPSKPSTPSSGKRPWWKPSWVSSVDPSAFSLSERPTRDQLLDLAMGEVQGRA